MSTSITITGNVASEPNYRVTQSGDPVADFRIAVTERRRNQAGDWEDGATEWFKVTAWNTLAENACESLGKGTRVTVTGTPKAEAWIGKDTGELKAGISITARDIAISVLFHPATTQHVQRDTTGSAVNTAPGTARRTPAPQDGTVVHAAF